MRCTQYCLLLAALCVAACSKPPGPDTTNTPANTPAPVKPLAPTERAYVVTCSPTTDNRSFQWFESGKEQPFLGENLDAHLEKLARAGGNWDAKNERSENRIALRIDARAPVSEFWRFIDSIAKCHVYKFAVAMLQEFDAPFSLGGGGEPMWDLDARYLKLQLPLDVDLSRESKEPEFSLGLSLNWKKQFSRCTLVTNFQKDTKTVAEIEQVFSELLPAVKEDKPFKRSEQGTYSFGAKVAEEALTSAAKRVKGKLTRVNVGEFGDPTSKHRLEAGEHAPVAYLFLALDSVTRLNQSRAEAGLSPVEIRFVFGAGTGRFETKLVQPPDPEVKPKEPKVEPWGDPPGEPFEPRAAFTVTIEKLEKPTADGAQFGYFFGGKAEPQTLKQLGEEVKRFAAWRSVKEGHPGWNGNKSMSGNVLAVRSDVAAPYLLTYRAMVKGVEAGMVHFAIAPRHEFPAEDYVSTTGADGVAERPILTRLTGQYLRYDWDKPSTLPWQEQVALIARRNTGADAVDYVVAVGDKPTFDHATARKLEEVCPELASSDDARNTATSAREKLIEILAKNIEARLPDAGAKAKMIEVSADDAEFCFVLIGLEAGSRVNEHLKDAGKPELIVKVSRPFPLPPEPEMKPEEKVEYPKDEPPEDPKDK